ncbi:MAG TPA: hypothetical protein VFP15_06275 [Gemmatimonadaceae bacterium]|nr:hypothetical protein [Gemmatimonadaceae bacterium]
MTTATVRRLSHHLGAAIIFAAMTACANTGGLGGILGSVLGGGQGNQLQGAISGVDTRAQQIGVQQSNGQTVWVRYDNNTQVLYQNQNYPVTSLERGDQVVATIQDAGNGSYYVSTVQVTQSVSNASGGVYGNQGGVTTYQGNVRQVDRSNGWFTVDEGSIGRITVTLPSGLSQQDLNRFSNLRSGDYVRFYGVRTGNSQVQLRQFY